MNITRQPLTSELKQEIYAGFKEHAIESMGFDGLGDLICFAAKDKSLYLGAIVFQPFWGALHIKYIWVNKKYRNNKIGSQLMEKAFEYGKNTRCAFAFVETMSFQAMEFYQKLGFQLEFTRSGFTKGLQFHYLQKNFI